MHGESILLYICHGSRFESLLVTFYLIFGIFKFANVDMHSRSILYQEIVSEIENAKFSKFMRYFYVLVNFVMKKRQFWPIF